MFRRLVVRAVQARLRDRVFSARSVRQVRGRRRVLVEQLALVARRRQLQDSVEHH
jgi:hypothetical protein